jgi:hypothetical protein
VNERHVGQQILLAVMKDFAAGGGHRQAHLHSAIDYASGISDYSAAMPTIHLLNQEGDQFPQPTKLKTGEWETGFWHISKKRSEELVDHSIHLHRRKADPPFLSGTISTYQRKPFTNPGSGKTTERSVFTFKEAEDEGSGVRSRPGDLETRPGDC